jgi:hypothetical protein
MIRRPCDYAMSESLQGRNPRGLGGQFAVYVDLMVGGLGAVALAGVFGGRSPIAVTSFFATVAVDEMNSACSAACNGCLKAPGRRRCGAGNKVYRRANGAAAEAVTVVMASRS